MRMGLHPCADTGVLGRCLRPRVRPAHARDQRVPQTYPQVHSRHDNGRGHERGRAHNRVPLCRTGVVDFRKVPQVVVFVPQRLLTQCKVLHVYSTCSEGQHTEQFLGGHCVRGGCTAQQNKCTARARTAGAKQGARMHTHMHTHANARTNSRMHKLTHSHTHDSWARTRTRMKAGQTDCRYSSAWRPCTPTHPRAPPHRRADKYGKPTRAGVMLPGQQLPLLLHRGLSLSHELVQVRQRLRGTRASRNDRGGSLSRWVRRKLVAHAVPRRAGCYASNPNTKQQPTTTAAACRVAHKGAVNARSTRRLVPGRPDTQLVTGRGQRPKPPPLTAFRTRRNSVSVDTTTAPMLPAPGPSVAASLPMALSSFFSWEYGTYLPSQPALRGAVHHSPHTTTAAPAHKRKWRSNWCVGTPPKHTSWCARTLERTQGRRG